MEQLPTTFAEAVIQNEVLRRQLNQTLDAIVTARGLLRAELRSNHGGSDGQAVLTAVLQTLGGE